MAKIIYSTLGESATHIQRAQAIATHLRERHEVVLLCPGAAYESLAVEFADDSQVQISRSPSVAFEKGGSALGNRLRKLTATMRYQFDFRSSVLKLVAQLDSERPQYVISDGEPLLLEAAKRTNIESLSLRTADLQTVNSETLEDTALCLGRIDRFLGEQKQRSQSTSQNQGYNSTGKVSYGAA